VPNPAFAVAEALWILSGSDAPWIFKYNARLAQFTDGGRLKGAYGPRIRHWHGDVDQVNEVRQLLRKDRSSRRAAIQIFDPSIDHHEFKDVPCTLSYRFYFRDGRLDMHTTMRSQDVWLGLCYDLFTGTLLHELMSSWLDMDLGAYHHHVDSLHLYERRLIDAQNIPVKAPPSELMEPVTVPWARFDGLLERVIGDSPPIDDRWHEFAAVMSSYRSWKDGHRDIALLKLDGKDGVLVRALRRWFERIATRLTA